MDSIETWKGKNGMEKFFSQFFVFSIGCIDERLFKDWEDVRCHVHSILGDIYMKIIEEGLGSQIQHPVSYIKRIIKNKAFDLNRDNAKDVLSASTRLDFHREPIYRPAEIGLTTQEFLRLFEKNHEDCSKTVSLVIDGLVYREVAKLLGVAVGTVHNCMVQARKFLLSLLK